MGNVDLNFSPSVPVFDANVALGRRHNRRVAVDTVDGTVAAMRRAGVGRALVYSPHAAAYDSGEGNALLLQMVRGEPSLVPQFVCSPASDDLGTFADQVARHEVRSVRMVPMLHNYPFRDWVVRPWLEWLAEEQISLWLPAGYDTHRGRVEIDPEAVYDTVSVHADVRVVLSEVRYSHLSWAMPLLRGLPNLVIDTSWLYGADGIPKLIEAAGHERILYGSRFPDAPIAPQLYELHRCGLTQPALAAICSGNLQRLLARA